MLIYIFFFFFFNDTATTEIYTLSLHDALPILDSLETIIESACKAYNEKITDSSYQVMPLNKCRRQYVPVVTANGGEDRKSTRLNSSHLVISYAVFCLKKKKPMAYAAFMLYMEA